MSMYILHVVPIARGIHAETLTYFSVKYVAPGNLVRVTYNHRDLVALTAKTELVRDLKADVKELYFQIKNISDVVTDYILPEACIRAGTTMAERYHFKLHAVLSQIIPKSYLEFLENLDPAINQPYSAREVDTPKNENGSKHTLIEGALRPRVHTSVFQAPTHERYEQYKTLTREYLSRQESVVIVVPTVHEANQLFTLISKGIGDRVFLIHGNLGKKKTQDYYAHVHHHPSGTRVVITTPAFLATASTPQVQLYVIENESSEAYLSNKEPYLQMREYLCLVATTTQTHLILGASLPSFEALGYIEQGTADMFQEPRYKLDTEASMYIHERSSLPKNTPWELFLPNTLDHLRSLVAKGDPVFFFVPKKGYASFIACRDCQTVVTCPSCTHNLTLHNQPSGKGRILRCHYCRTNYPTSDICSHCQGHRLQLLGVTVERVLEELQHLFPTTPVTCIDALHTTTEKQIQTVIDTWREQGGFLIGTHLALSHIAQYDHVIIPSLESLLARPEYTTEERVMRLLIDIVEKTSYSCTFQVQDQHHPLLHDIQIKNISEYIRRELALRKTFLYPPYTTVLYVRFLECSLDQTQQATLALEHHLLTYAPYFIERSKGPSTRLSGVFLVLKVPISDWDRYCVHDEACPLFRFIADVPLPVEIYAGLSV